MECGDNVGGIGKVWFREVPKSKRAYECHKKDPFVHEEMLRRHALKKKAKKKRRKKRGG